MTTLRTGGSYVADPKTGETTLVERTLQPSPEKTEPRAAKQRGPKPPDAPATPAASAPIPQE